MADAPVVVLAHCVGGQNSALDPALLPGTQAAKLINCQIDQQLITTRFGTRFLPVSGDQGWRTENIQGAKFYDPAKGQGTQVFSDDSASIVLAAGGNKYRFFPEVTDAAAVNITQGFSQDNLSLLVWLEAAENFLIGGDDKGSTYIYDGADARFSAGHIGTGTEEERAGSEIPNAVRAMVYAHGRLWVVQNARRIFASDSIHGENQTQASDLLKFVEQVYWATGQYFVPPSSMGNIIASQVLPTRDTRTGQGEIMFHCVNGGVFSINGNIYPRSLWSETPMVTHFLLDTGASGPYAVDFQEGDQLFRSRSGIQTLRSARAESRLVGRPLKPISEEVGVWMDADHKPYLRYASLVNIPQLERLFCTVSPQVAGQNRYHRGVVVMNSDAVDSGQAAPSWEGLWTFPSSYKYVVQMVRGMIADDERIFGFHFDGVRNSLVEYDPTLTADQLEDGTEKPIVSRVVTRAISGPDPYLSTPIVSASLYLRDIKRTTKWSIYARTEREECWTRWRSGEVCVPDCNPTDDLTANQVRHAAIEIGSPPEGMQIPARRWQFMIEWEGWCRIEAFRVMLGASSDRDVFSEDALAVDCKFKPVCCDEQSNDYSYSDGDVEPLPLPEVIDPDPWVAPEPFPFPNR